MCTRACPLAFGRLVKLLWKHLWLMGKRHWVVLVEFQFFVVLVSLENNWQCEGVWHYCHCNHTVKDCYCQMLSSRVFVTNTVMRHIAFQLVTGHMWHVRQWSCRLQWSWRFLWPSDIVAGMTSQRTPHAFVGTLVSTDPCAASRVKVST